MPELTFDISATVPGDGDVHTNKYKPWLVALGVTNAVLNLAWVPAFPPFVPNPFDHPIWFRFEPDIPFGSTINGVKIQLWVENYVLASGIGLNTRGGFLARDGVWDAAAGFVGYATQDSMPLAEWNEATGNDPSVWWGGAPAFTERILPTAFEQDGSMGDGIAAPHTVTGLAAQLESYLSDASNEAARGTGVSATGVPVCFTCYRPWVASAVVRSITVTSENGANAAHRPKLVIDYSEPVETGLGITGRQRMQPAVSGIGRLRSGVSGAGRIG